jgi:hypothetical protein
MTSRPLQPFLYELRRWSKEIFSTADGDSYVGPKPRVRENDVVPTMTDEAEMNHGSVSREKLCVALGGIVVSRSRLGLIDHSAKDIYEELVRNSIVVFHAISL